MTSKKKQKRAIRARASANGTSYSTARRAMTASGTSAAPSAAGARARLEAASWVTTTLSFAILEIACDDCGEKLLVPIAAAPGTNPDLTCEGCGATEAVEQYAPRAIKAYAGRSARAGSREPGDDDDPIGWCPECGLETFVAEDGACAACGQRLDKPCIRCGSPIPVSEMSEYPMCGYCSHVSSKDD